MKSLIYSLFSVKLDVLLYIYISQSGFSLLRRLTRHIVPDTSRDALHGYAWAPTLPLKHKLVHLVVACIAMLDKAGSTSLYNRSPGYDYSIALSGLSKTTKPIRKRVERAPILLGIFLVFRPP